MEKDQLCILLVDDDEDDFVMTRDLLAEVEGASFVLEWVATYDAAREVIERQEHSVYLLDYRLGAHTGLELLREALKRGYHAPMILLTGQGDHEVDCAAMKAGAADYLVKGQINASLLERSIRYAIERKQAEAERLRLEAQLFQAQKMDSIGALASGVVHDFNNLLTAILGFTQLSRARLEPDHPLHDHLTGVIEAANRAASLTRQLLAFSRHQQLQRQGFDLNETISNLMKMLERIIGEDVAVEMQASPQLPAIFADPAQIEQVVMNLAVNARDAMPAGGRLLIETNEVRLDQDYCREQPWAKPGQYVQLTVSDTGIGMDGETQRRIFEPFFTTKEAGKGTGLGLAVVYGIISQHDGLIHVYSEVGHGTTFKVYLPVEEQTAEAAVEQQAQTMLRGGTETILVAEDEEMLRKLAQEVLTSLGYTVLLASDGQEAVEMYAAHRQQIDLVMLDAVMPRLGGREAYQRMRELGSEVPVIFMTGYSAELVQSQLITGRGVALIQKPYSIPALGRKVREVLDQTDQAGGLSAGA